MALEIDIIPGFRFHPTDEELVGYYLRRKVCSKRFCVDMISDADVYKVEPWDLPDLSSLKTRDLEWYFFSVLDKKYGNGCRTNRATEKGYWKTTGKDRTVYNGSQMVGMKKTLVYHIGRAPKGNRTHWVMHEYRLVDQELEKAGIVQDVFVLCRLVQNPATELNQDEEERLRSQNDSSSGDELHVTHIENSTSSEKIFQENILLPVPEALEQGMKAMVENRIAPLETKYKTAPILLSQEAIEDQYGKTMKEAAKTLDVSISTLKRKCRAFGISEWQGPSPAKRKVNDLYSNQSDTNEEDTGTIQEPLPINRNEHTLTIKAEYAGDVIKFRLHIFQATFETVMEEIGTRLKLTPGTYKVKYLDEDKDWILLTSEQDISDCIKTSRNSDQNAVRLHVEPST